MPKSDKKTEVTGYCVKCKAKQPMQEVQKITMKNGRPAQKGKCPKCGTGMFKIGAASYKIPLIKQAS